MALTVDERDERLEERAKALGQQPNYCPFGCQHADLDEYGYCKHLQGFTNDGINVETIQKRERRVKDPDTGEVSKEDTGLRYVSGKKSHLAMVEPGDKLINPERIERNAGIVSIVKAWVSPRVYRPHPDDAKPAAKAERAQPAAKPTRKRKRVQREEETTAATADA